MELVGGGPRDTALQETVQRSTGENWRVPLHATAIVCVAEVVESSDTNFLFASTLFLEELR